jgi:hypothetical protein
MHQWVHILQLYQLGKSNRLLIELKVVVSNWAYYNVMQTEYVKNQVIRHSEFL